jgi:DNA polymerase III epsilon subunit-like protein
MSTPATVPATLAALWARLRLVVIDVETVSADDGLHVVEVGVVICRDARRTSRTWVARINPGVPVDARSRAVHGIDDADLVDEPPFGHVAPELSRRLRGLDGETVMLAGHNISFDVAVLRREYQRLGLDLPDLPVLDIQLLPRHVGLPVGGGRLSDLLGALGLSNPNAHSAGGDAEATANAVIALLEAAATAGRSDFDALHRITMQARGRTHDILPAAARRPRHAVEDEADEDREPELPEVHTSAHTTILKSLRTAQVRAWKAELLNCARLRCPYTADRVQAAEVEADRVRGHVEDVLDQLFGDEMPDVPAVATLVGALTPLLVTQPNRSAALKWHDRWKPRLAQLGRCDRNDRTTTACPSCRAGHPCPPDTWPRLLAVAARGPVTVSSRKSFLHTTGADLGRGVFTTWLAAGRRQLAEATAWLVYEEHRHAGQVETAATFARYIFLAGAREPRLAAAYASLLAAPGSLDALQRGVDTCDETLLSRQGSTDDGWVELASRRSQLLGRASRLRDRTSGQLDADGNPVPLRRHHPLVPHRTRARRFAPR